VRRAALIFNPEAAGVSPRVRDVIAHALSSELKIDIAATTHRHHATELAAGAVRDGYEAVAVLGGDGTLNEVINGLAGSDVPVIPIPGGGTNVFARTMGLPKDPIEATSVLLEHLRTDPPARRINLGRVNGRAFAFCAGVGIDAAVVHSVEQNPRLKKRFGEVFFVALAVRSFVFASKRNGPLTLAGPTETYDGLFEVAVCNSDPFTFLGARPFRVCPAASLEGGLDAAAMSSIRVPIALRIVLSSFGSQKHLKMRSVRTLHDADGFTVEAARPMPYQVDGDYSGEATTFRFESVPGALSVLV